MNSILIRFVLGAVLLAQAPATLPIRIGELALRLTDSEAFEVAQIASPIGPSPWLLYAYRAQIGNVMAAYLPPDSSTKEIRRGDLISLSRRPGTATSAPGPWQGRRLSRYAQVAVVGRDFGQIQGEMDINRPFEIQGEFTDDDLVHIVRLIRTSTATSFNGQKLWSDLPISSIIRQDGNYAVVWIPKDPAGEMQRVQFRRPGTEWFIADISNGIA